MLSVKNLHKNIGDAQILKDVSFTLNDNGITVVLGPSGSGKTTLIRCISKLEPFQSGEIEINGKNIADIPNWQLGMVFQSFNLFPHLTVLENLILAPINVLGMSDADAQKKAMDLLEEFDLSSKAQERPARLSGGQKQRIAIARCLMMDPPVILMDEPTSALDPEIVYDVANIIKSLKRQDRSIIVISHEVRLAHMVADDILFFDQGVLLDHLSAKDFFDGKEGTVSPRARQYLLNYNA